jgi:hypothetical protein
MMENGLMIKLMDLVCISISMELFMKAIGKKIYSMEKVLKNGLMVHHILEITFMERNKVQDFIIGMMVLSMEENGMKIKYLEQESTHG